MEMTVALGDEPRYPGFCGIKVESHDTRHVGHPCLSEGSIKDQTGTP